MVAEMRMIRWMCGYTRTDRIRNEGIREIFKVVPIEDKMGDTRLRQFGYVKRMSLDAHMRRCESINMSEGSRGRGQSKKSLNEVIGQDFKVLGLMKDMVQDKRL